MCWFTYFLIIDILFYTKNYTCPIFLNPNYFPKLFQIHLLIQTQPSGMLCSVTASTIIVVFFSFPPILSELLPSKCKFSIITFINSRKKIPNNKPIVAGIHATIFWSSAIFIDGINKDHTEAAIITPDANPNKIFSNLSFILFFIKSTIAAPSVVPKKGIANPQKTSIKITPFFRLYIILFA